MNPKKLTLFLIPLILLLCAFLSACNSEKKVGQNNQRPNIIFILSDDHTPKAIGAYGGMFKDFVGTDHIDNLASEGVLFRNVFCNNSICSPSRATVLTGKYSHKNGIRLLNQRFDSTQMTFPKVLQANGYKTAVFGKWHLKSRPTGFDEYKVLEKQGRYLDPQFFEKGKEEMVTYRGWSTDVITEMATSFIDKQEDEKPFFLFCNYKATHDPWASRPPYDTLFENTEMPIPDNFYDTYDDRSEAVKKTTLRIEKINQGTFPHTRLENVSDSAQRYHIYQQYIKAFFRCGKVLDENIGKLKNYLKEKDLLKNTIIIYTADQGHFLGEHGFFSKRFMLEEPLSMPLIIRFPDNSPYNQKEIEEMIVNIDFAPSVLEMANVAIPEEMQGESFMPLLEGKDIPWRTSMYYHYWQHRLHRNVMAHYGIRDERYKLIFYYSHPLGFTDFEPEQPEWELFDLETDPAEMFNQYNNPEYTNIILELKKELLELKDQYEDYDSIYPDMQPIVKKYFWEES